MTGLVDVLRAYSNNPAYLSDLRMTLKAVAQDDPDDDEPAFVSSHPRSRFSLVDRLALEGVHEVTKQYQTGVTAQELADKYSVSLSTIKRLLRKSGARRRNKPPT